MRPCRATRTFFLVLLLLASATSLAETLVWNLDQALVPAHPGTFQLRDSKANTVASVPNGHLIALKSARDRISSATGIAPKLLVSNQRTANAYGGVTNDGPIVMFTLPMIERLGADEGLIAAIMGHEFGHIAHRHTGRSERVAASSILGILAGIAAGALIGNAGLANLAATAVDMGGRAAIHSYDRDQEREADAFGLDAMAKAGYDPADAARLWATQQVGSGGGVFTTHPSSDERLVNVRQLVAQRPSANPSRVAAAANGVTPQLPPTSASLAAPPQVHAREGYAAEGAAVESPPSIAEPPSDVPSAPAQERTAVAMVRPADSASAAAPSTATELPRKSEGERFGLTPAQDKSGLWGYIDAGGAWRIPPNFAAARPFSRSEVAAVAVGTPGDLRWGYIGTTGAWEITARFEAAGDFDVEVPGLARVKVGEGSFAQFSFVNRQGVMSAQR